MNSTRAEIIGDTVEFFPHHKKITFMSSADSDSMVVAYLTEALIHPNTETPFSKVVETQLADLRKLATLFQYRLKKLVHLKGRYRYHQNKV